MIQLKAIEGKDKKVAASSRSEADLSRYLEAAKALDKAGVDCLSLYDLKSGLFQRASPGQEVVDAVLVSQLCSEGGGLDYLAESARLVLETVLNHCCIHADSVGRPKSERDISLPAVRDLSWLY